MFERQWVHTLKSSTKIWLTYSFYGFIVFLLCHVAFEAFPSIRVISREGVVFGVMFALMGAAISKATEKAKEEKQKSGEDPTDLNPDESYRTQYLPQCYDQTILLSLVPVPSVIPYQVIPGASWKIIQDVHPPEPPMGARGSFPRKNPHETHCG